MIIQSLEYFETLSRHRYALGINVHVNVEVLGRGRNDTNSTPKDVIELLDEYIQLREKGESVFLKMYQMKFLCDMEKIYKRDERSFYYRTMKVLL